MVLEYVGWIGLGILVLSFGLLVTKYSKYFIITDLIATLFLLAHSIIIKDLPFILVNAFMTTALTIKHFQGGIE